MANFQSVGGPFWSNGPAPGQFYNFPGTNINATPNTLPGPVRHDGGRITTGTSVIGIKYKDGVIIAADNLVSYGKMARFQNVDRVFKINDKTIIGVGGDYADFQYIKRLIDQHVINDESAGDTINLKPKSLYTYLTRVFYNRRCRMNPLWLDVIVGGMQDDEPFLGHVSVRGKAYESNCVGTGFGNHLSIPLFREVVEQPNADITLQKAQEVVKKCMEVLFYRDCVAYPKFSQALCTKDGVEVSKDLAVDQNWQVGYMIRGF